MGGHGWAHVMLWVGIGRCRWLWSGYGYKFEGKCWALLGRQVKLEWRQHLEGRGILYWWLTLLQQQAASQPCFACYLHTKPLPALMATARLVTSSSSQSVQSGAEPTSSCTSITFQLPRLGRSSSSPIGHWMPSFQNALGLWGGTKVAAGKPSLAAGELRKK